MSNTDTNILSTPVDGVVSRRTTGMVRVLICPCSVSTEASASYIPPPSTDPGARGLYLMIARVATPVPSIFAPPLDV